MGSFTDKIVGPKRILTLSDEVKEKAAALAEFASRRENWYFGGESDFVPGDNPDYVLRMNDYRCVFTYTLADSKLYRHLTISVPGKNYPHPAAVLTVAHMFGFTGAKLAHGTDDVVAEAGEDWQMAAKEAERCIVVVQEIPNGRD